MTPEQFWEGDPYLVRAYYQKHKLYINQRNQELWLQGLYIYQALNTVVGNALRKKGQPTEKYLEKPIDLFPEETARKKAEEEREKIATYFEAMRKNWVAKHGSTN